MLPKPTRRRAGSASKPCLRVFHVTRLLDGMALVIRTSYHGPTCGRGSGDEGVADSVRASGSALCFWHARDRSPSGRLCESTGPHSRHRPSCSFKQPGHPWRGWSALSPSGCSSRPSHHRMDCDGQSPWCGSFAQDVWVYWQSVVASAWPESPAATIVDPPVLVDYPTLSLCEDAGDVAQASSIRQRARLIEFPEGL